MGTGTPVEQRRQRNMQLLSFLCKEDVEKMELTVDKIAFFFSSRWGLTTVKVKEYLNMFRIVGAVTVDRKSKIVKITEYGRRLAKGADLETELFPIASIES